MVLRWLVGGMLRRAAREKVAEAVAEATGRKESAPSEHAQPDEEPAAAACEVGVVFALSIEVGGLLDRMSGVITRHGQGFVAHEGKLAGRQVGAITTGPGRAAAVHGTAALIAGHAPRWIVSAGFAGALDGSLARGDIVVANRIIDVGGSQLAIDFQLDETPGVRVGSLLTVDSIVRTPDERRRLAAEHGAMAVDMETFAVAERCREERIRFLSVRKISDTVDDCLPDDIEHLMRQHGLAGRAGAVTGALFRRPGSLKDMWRLKETALVASERLAKFLAEMLGSLD